jgi:hypothetical protein
MIIKSLENIEQVENLQIGDIFPILDQADWIDGRMIGMIEKKEQNQITFIAQHPFSKSYLRYQIKDINRERGVIENPFDMKDVTRFWISAYSDTPNAKSERIDDNDPIIKKYREEIKNEPFEKTCHT